jgi:hypothetical protein
MMSTPRRTTPGSLVAATTATMALLLGGATAASAAALPSDPERITIEGQWRTIAAGQTQHVDEVRCPETHPFVFNEMYGGRPWKLTPGVEVLVEHGRTSELEVDIRATIPRLEDKTAIGIGPARLNRVTLNGAAAVAYRVDVHCTSDENDSYS